MTEYRIIAGDISRRAHRSDYFDQSIFPTEELLFSSSEFLFLFRKSLNLGSKKVGQRCGTVGMLGARKMAQKIKET